MTGEARLLVTSAEAFQLRMGDPEQFRASVVRLRPGDRIQPRDLMDRLVRMGYERVDMVEGKGQCAIRGAIVDVYPPNLNDCLRIEFFDDEVDSLRSIDPMSQRSRDNLQSAMICPASEVLVAPEEAPAAARRMRDAIQASVFSGTGLSDDLPPLPEDEEEAAPIRGRARNSQEVSRQLEQQRRQELLLQDAQLLEGGLPFRRIRSWLPIVSPEAFYLTDWYRPEVVVLYQPDQLRNRFEDRLKGFSADLKSAIERGDAVPAQEALLTGWEDALHALRRYCVVAASEILHGQGGIETQDALDMNAAGLPGFHGKIRDLAQSCEAWLKKDLKLVLLSGGEARGRRLAAALEENGLRPVCRSEAGPFGKDSLLILPQTLSRGFLWEEAGLCLISDADIYGSDHRRTKARSTSGEKISAFTDLHQGDYVVHEDHGVGIYQGISRIQSEGVWHEYLLIQYAGTDKLYVPVEQLSRVQRYIGNPDNPPKLNNIGGGEWSRQKSKVRAGLKELAFDLVQLYARRSQTEGFAFSPDTAWQREFEDQFPYELTPDQAQSVREITADMESHRNMDRLLCGDVGYGKTEVSLRAAFKALQDSKQVAILAPTTILAQQHYNTVLKRFDHFPVKVALLSRFQNAAQVKEILARLKEGDIDILVGTHRALGKDVQFKNLGLLIVDEEQRFGVSHKEIIKNMKTQVDVLTLSATPIPRTLHMSMVGIRDMSVLETPPEERLPVQTHVIDYSDAIVRDAIIRELNRGGQVYFLYNRVQSIHAFHERLRQLVPEARVAVAYGQMKGHQLEDVMMDFYAGSYDVLLCTTIIENGLDVPTANTLIVFDADRFGLSQLYQLRGRVGRSTRQAYAYFTVRPDKMMSETAQQRLNAIREFTEFGSGFRIAMRDLEIRGAGNILGPEQHGHLSTVGYDMYCKLMEETLQEVQGVKTDAKPLETRVDLKVDAFLPEDYVSGEKQRMEMYKRIAGLSSPESRDDIEEELVDRFGDIPAVVDTLLDIAQIRYLANTLGVMRVSSRENALHLRIDNRYIPEPAILLQAMFETDPRLKAVNVPFPAIVLQCRCRGDRDLLREGIAVLKKLTQAVSRLENAQSPQK